MFRRSRRSRVGVVAMVAALALLAGACGDGDDEEADGTEVDAAEEQDSGEEAAEEPGEVDSAGEAPAADDYDPEAELTFAHSFGASSLDPHTAASTAGWSAWMRPVYDRLLTLDVAEDGSVEIVPQLATSYEISEDGLDLSMELRDDVTFQTGAAFDASVVQANIDRAKNDEASTVASMLTAVEEVEVVDDYNVVFHLTEPFPGLAYSLAADTIGMMVDPAAFDTDLSTEPAGSGPYQLVSFEPDGAVVYERWDGYWDPEAAKLARITIVTVPDANARFNGVRSGEYDIGYMSQPTDLESRDLAESGDYQWTQVLAPLANGILMNTSLAPFDDVRVRNAVAMAIDREAIAEELLGGMTQAEYQPFAAGYLGNDPELANPYDPEAAAALIEEAGVSGQTVTLLANATAPFDSIAQILQQSLGEIGLNVEIEPINPSEGIPRWLEGNTQFYSGSILAEPEPSLTLNRSYLGAFNIGGPDEELVQMASEAALIPLDSPEREAAYQEISQYLTENTIHTPVVLFSTSIFAQPDVIGIEKVAPVVVGKLDVRQLAKAGS